MMKKKELKENKMSMPEKKIYTYISWVNYLTLQ